MDTAAQDGRIADRFMPIGEVMRTTSIARSTIYDWIRQGLFPKPHKLGPRRVGWRESEITGWTTNRQPTP